MSDPRKNRPSASQMHQVAACPGSFALEQQLNLAESPGPYAAAGTRIAEYLEAMRSGRRSVPTLKPAEKDIADACLASTEKAKAALARSTASGIFDSVSTQWMTEVRLWDTTEKGHQFSGRFDLAAINAPQGVAVIVDDKSGWGDVPAADVNLQLRTLAVLAFANWPVTKVFVVLNQPAKGEPSIACYSYAGLVSARREIEGYVDAASLPGGPRKATPHGCKYCTAKSFCPEVMEVLTKLSNGEISGDWQTALDQCEVAQLVIDDLRAKAKAVLATDPNAIPGWKLQPGATRTTVKDAKGAFGLLSDVVTSDEYMGCCTVKIGDLTKVYQAKAGIKSAKSARSAMEARIASVIEQKQGEPLLKRADAKEEA